MRPLQMAILGAVLVTAALSAAVVRFAQPLEGSQVVGPTLLEVTTDASSVDRVDFYVDNSLAGVARKPPYRIAHDFGGTIERHEITAHVRSNGYRGDDIARVTTAPSGEVLNVDLVEVPIRARSPQPLRPADITVLENGIEQTIRNVRADRGPARFVFVVDRSLSMGDGRLEAALQAIDGEIGALRPDDEVEITLFNHHVGRARGIPRGESVRRIIGNVVPSGGTSLRDALVSVALPRRTWTIVITDGGDRNSQSSEKDVLEKVSGRNVVVDAVVLGRRSELLDQLAANTGGTVVHADAESLRSELHRLIADINSRYTLVYQSHGNSAGWRAIDIRPVSRSIEILRARQGYFAE